MSSMELQNVSSEFISRFHFHYSPHSTDRKWCLFAIQKITKAIFATPTKQFLLADEEFSPKTHISQQHGNTEREYCVYLTFSFSLSTSFDREGVMFVCDSEDNKSYLRDTNETNLASRWKVFIKKTQITEQHGITEREYCVYLTFSFSLSTSFNRQEVKFVCDSKDNKSYLRDINKTIFASRWRVFMKKTHISQQHGKTEREYCVYLTFSFSLFTSFNRQEVMFVCHSKDNKSYLRDTNETILARRWRVMKKTQITEQHGITEREYFVYLTFSFSLFTSFDREEVMFVCDSKDNKSYLRDTNETILASRWKVFIKKTQITEQHGITEREYWAYLTFSFSLFTSFNRQEVMLVYDSKGNKSYLRDTNETILASRWKVFIKKNPKNWAAWNYRTWVFRLSHVFIFIIHLIQQTGSEVCLRFKR